MVTEWRPDYLQRGRVSGVLRWVSPALPEVGGPRGEWRASGDGEGGWNRLSGIDDGRTQQRIPVVCARRKAVCVPDFRARRVRAADYESGDEGDYGADQGVRQFPAVVAARRFDYVLAAGAGSVRDLHGKAGWQWSEAADVYARE